MQVCSPEIRKLIIRDLNILNECKKKEDREARGVNSKTHIAEKYGVHRNTVYKLHRESKLMSLNTHMSDELVKACSLFRAGDDARASLLQIRLEMSQLGGCDPDPRNRKDQRVTILERRIVVTDQKGDRVKNGVEKAMLMSKVMQVCRDKNKQPLFTETEVEYMCELNTQSQTMYKLRGYGFEYEREELKVELKSWLRTCIVTSRNIDGKVLWDVYLVAEKQKRGGRYKGLVDVKGGYGVCWWMCCNGFWVRDERSIEYSKYTEALLVILNAANENILSVPVARKGGGAGEKNKALLGPKDVQLYCQVLHSTRLTLRDAALYSRLLDPDFPSVSESTLRRVALSMGFKKRRDKHVDPKAQRRIESLAHSDEMNSFLEEKKKSRDDGGESLPRVLRGENLLFQDETSFSLNLNELNNSMSWGREAKEVTVSKGKTLYLALNVTVGIVTAEDGIVTAEDGIVTAEDGIEVKSQKDVLEKIDEFKEKIKNHNEEGVWGVWKLPFKLEKKKGEASIPNAHLLLFWQIEPPRRDLNIPRDLTFDHTDVLDIKECLQLKKDLELVFKHHKNKVKTLFNVNTFDNLVQQSEALTTGKINDDEGVIQANVYAASNNACEKFATALKRLFIQIRHYEYDEVTDNWRQSTIKIQDRNYEYDYALIIIAAKKLKFDKLFEMYNKEEPLTELITTLDKGGLRRSKFDHNYKGGSVKAVTGSRNTFLNYIRVLSDYCKAIYGEPLTRRMRILTDNASTHGRVNVDSKKASFLHRHVEELGFDGAIFPPARTPKYNVAELVFAYLDTYLKRQPMPKTGEHGHNTMARYMQDGLESITPSMVTNWVISRGYCFSLKTVEQKSFPKSMFIKTVSDATNTTTSFVLESCNSKMNGTGKINSNDYLIALDDRDRKSIEKEVSQYKVILDDYKKRLDDASADIPGLLKEFKEGSPLQILRRYSASYDQFGQVDEKEKGDAILMDDVKFVLKRIVDDVEAKLSRTNNSNRDILCNMGVKSACRRQIRPEFHQLRCIDENGAVTDCIKGKDVKLTKFISKYRIKGDTAARRGLWRSICEYFTVEIENSYVMNTPAIEIKEDLEKKLSHEYKDKEDGPDGPSSESFFGPAMKTFLNEMAERITEEVKMGSIRPPPPPCSMNDDGTVTVRNLNEWKKVKSGHNAGGSIVILKELKHPEYKVNNAAESANFENLNKPKMTIGIKSTSGTTEHFKHSSHAYFDDKLREIALKVAGNISNTDDKLDMLSLFGIVPVQENFTYSKIDTRRGVDRHLPSTFIREIFCDALLKFLSKSLLSHRDDIERSAAGGNIDTIVDTIVDEMHTGIDEIKMCQNTEKNHVQAVVNVQKFYVGTMVKYLVKQQRFFRVDESEKEKMLRKLSSDLVYPSEYIDALHDEDHFQNFIAPFFSRNGKLNDKIVGKSRDEEEEASPEILRRWPGYPVEKRSTLLQKFSLISTKNVKANEKKDRNFIIAMLQAWIGDKNRNLRLQQDIRFFVAFDIREYIPHGKNEYIFPYKWQMDIEGKRSMINISACWKTIEKIQKAAKEEKVTDELEVYYDFIDEYIKKKPNVEKILRDFCTNHNNGLGESGNLKYVENETNQAMELRLLHEIDSFDVINASTIHIHYNKGLGKDRSHNVDVADVYIGGHLYFKKSRSRGYQEKPKPIEGSTTQDLFSKVNMRIKSGVPLAFWRHEIQPAKEHVDSIQKVWLYSSFKQNQKSRPDGKDWEKVFVEIDENKATKLDKPKPENIYIAWKRGKPFTANADNFELYNYDKKNATTKNVLDDENVQNMIATYIDVDGRRKKELEKLEGNKSQKE